MWKLIAITSLSLTLAAPPMYTACSQSQVDACTTTSNACADGCNILGAPQSCYDACVCGYYKCRENCGDGIVPTWCPSN